MKSVLVTGASGKLGFYIVKYLLDHTSNHVVAQFNSNSSKLKKLKSPRLELSQFDFNESNVDEWLGKMFRDKEFSFIFNAASNYPSNKIENMNFEELISQMKVGMFVPYLLAKYSNTKSTKTSLVFFLDPRVGKNSKADTAYLISKNSLNFIIKNLETTFTNCKFYTIIPTIINEKDLIDGEEKEVLLNKALRSILSNEEIFEFVI